MGISFAKYINADAPGFHRTSMRDREVMQDYRIDTFLRKDSENPEA